MPVVYEVKQPIKHAGIGLERQPGQTVSSAELHPAAGWADTLVEAGAIVERDAKPAKPATKKGGRDVSDS